LLQLKSQLHTHNSAACHHVSTLQWWTTPVVISNMYTAFSSFITVLWVQPCYVYICSSLFLVWKNFKFTSFTKEQDAARHDLHWPAPFHDCWCYKRRAQTLSKVSSIASLLLYCLALVWVKLTSTI